MNIYAENILDHFRSPRHYGALAGASVDHEEFNHACGDSLHLWLTLSGGKIVDIGWTGTGCAISQASMSLLSEELVGMSEVEALALTQEQIYALLGVPIGPRRFKCALMSVHTLKNAIHKAHGNEVQSWVETVSIRV
jgi:nitrogen fixation protein NifU and related proteins